jgi:excinuclease UvrABC nuclease subunit
MDRRPHLYSRDRIPELVIADAGQLFNGDDFRALRKPCVYLLMKDGMPIYIGMSRHGMQRIAQHSHKQAGQAIEECDEVKVYPCIAVWAAYRLEKILISKTQPKYNRRLKLTLQQEMLGK